MSMRALETAIVKALRVLLCNPKLRNKDMLAWSTGMLYTSNEAELVVFVADPGVNVCVLKEHDKREAAP